jgi:prepilin-type N-terminal cleavage/methylation domain-containing protein
MMTMRYFKVQRMPVKNTGFTLIELLVVMGIIMILVSIAVPAANIARLKAKDTEVRSGCNSIQVALESFGVDHAGCYPGAHWEQDSAGNFLVGPGVIGALPSYNGTEPRKDFTTGKTAGQRLGPGDEDPFLADGTPNVDVQDELTVGGYLPDYPANPFLKATGSAKSQMGNLFLFNPQIGVAPPTVGMWNTLDWNRYTRQDIANDPYKTMRQSYDDFGRGFFSYIPLNPVNNTGYDYLGGWAGGGGLSIAQLSDYYKRCRGYMLIGWGHSRLDDTQAAGISEKYWNTRLGAFDFDNSGTADQLERDLSDATSAGLIYPEMVDSDGSVGKFGGTLPGGAPDIDPAFYGAAFVKITGS